MNTLPATQNGRLPAIAGLLIFLLGSLAGLHAADTSKLDVRDLAINGQVKDNKARITIEADIAGLSAPKPAPIFATALQHAMRASIEKLSHSIRLEIDVIQGEPQEVALVLSGEGEIRQVTGDGLRDWSVRQEGGGNRLLVLRLATNTAAGSPFVANIEAETKLGSLPKTITPLALAAPRTALFSGFVRVDAPPELMVRHTNTAGLLPVEPRFLPATLAAPAAEDATALTFRFQATPYSLPLVISLADPESRQAVLVDSRIEGRLSVDDAAFTLTATARVRNPKGGTINLLQGNVALAGTPSVPGARLRYEDCRFIWSVDRPGEYPIRLQFHAAQRHDRGWHYIDFQVAPSPVQPLVLEGLPPETQFTYAEAPPPRRDGNDFVTFLPASGAFHLGWREARTETEGRLFFSVEALAQLIIRPGLAAQTMLLDFKITQGELNDAVLWLEGAGEVTRVQGPSVLAWNVEPGVNGGPRKLLVRFNAPQKDHATVQVQTQNPLGVFPQAVTALRIRPEGATRFAGYLRIVNEGAVRLEMLQSQGASQISPEQFPETDLTRSVLAPSGSQRFAFRFSGPDHLFRVQADNILPELSVSELLAYHLGETELAIDAELELDIREAPLREVLLRIPQGFGIARLNAAGLSDYFVRDETNGMAELRLVYTQPVGGRQVVQLRLERNAALGETNWTLPRIEVVKPKSVRGHLAVSADPGYRLSPVGTQGLTEIATAFFPRKLAGIQAAFRLSDADWRASLRVERLPHSIQADAMHLFSIAEGVAYGSSLINYFISGAPVSTFRFELSDEYFNVEFTGKDVRNWQKTPQGYVVQLHTPVSGAFALLATYERPFKSQGATLTFTGARPLDAQTEQGYTIVISAYQFQVKPVNVSQGLLAVEPAEIPPEQRLFFDAPILAAYRYTARPFALQLQLSPLAQGDTLNQVVERAAFTTRISKEGQVVTDARYFVKSRGQTHFKLAVPSGMQLWSVTVNGATTVPAKETNVNLVPLPQRADPNALHQIDMKLASRSARADYVRVSTPAAGAPVLLARWELLPESGRRLEYESGSLAPPPSRHDHSGFARLYAMLGNHAGGKLAIRLGLTLVLVLLAIGLWRAVLRSDTYRWSPRHLSGLVLGLAAAALAVVVLVSLADMADSPRPPASGALIFVAPVQQSGTAMTAAVSNIDDEAAGRTVFAAWPVLLALVIWALAWARSAQPLRAFLVLLGWVFLFWAALRLPQGAPMFFLLLIAFIVLHVVVPGLRALMRIPVKPVPAPVATAALLLLLGASALPVHAQQQVAQQQSLQPSTTPPPIIRTNRSPVAESVIQEVRVEENFAQARATVRWEVTRKDDLLPVIFEPAVLTRFVYPTNALKLVTLSTGESRRGHYLQALSTGIFEAMIEYRLPLSQRDNTPGFALPTRHGLLNRLTLEVVGQSVDVQSPQAASVERQSSAPTNSVAMLMLIPIDNAWITWKPRTRDPSREQAVFYTEWNHLFVPAPGVIEGLHQAQVRPARGELSELIFDVPPGMTISDVLDGTATMAQDKAAPPVVSLWRFDPDARKLRVRLSPPQARPFNLRIRSQVSTGPLPLTNTVSLITVSNAAGQFGLVGVATGSEVQLDTTQPTAVSAINLEDFPTSLTASMPGPIPGLTLRRAWRFTDAGAVRVRIHASAVAPDIRLETQETLSLGEDRTVLAANVTAQITRAGIFRLSFVLPPNLDVETISGQSMSHWTELRVGDDRVITLHLRGKTEGQQQFAVTLVGPGVKPARGFAVPHIVWRDVSKQRGQLVIVPEQGLRLQVASRESLTQLDPEKAGIRQKGVLAFRLLDADWKLSLDIEQVAPWVQVTGLQHVTLTEAHMKVVANLQYNIENTGLKALSVTLPTNAENVRFRGEQVADFMAAGAAGTNGSATRWDVKLHRRVIGQYLLQIHYQVRLPEPPNQPVIVGIQALGVDLQRGFLTLGATTRLQPKVDPLPQSFQPAEWQSIPRALQQDLQSATAIHTFRLLEPGATLPVRIERHEVARLLPARVNSAQFTTVLADDAQGVTLLRLDLVPGDTRLLRLRLPQNARFWFAYVNQNSVWPWLDGPDLLIPLEQQSRVNEAISVELFYSASAGRTLSRSLDVSLVAPKFELPLENITWRLFIDEKWRLDDWSGSLQLQRETPIQPVASEDIRSYFSKQARINQEKTKQAEQMLNFGNNFLQQGDPQQARRAFQAAYGLSQHDQAFNEDARVQLHNLKLQQALVGLNVRQAGGGTAAAEAPAAQLQAGQQGNQPAYTQRQAKELLDRNTADDNAGLMRLAERLIQQQDAAMVAPTAIRVTMPEQGRQLVFTRSVQVDPTAPLVLKAELSRVHATPSLLKLAFLLFTFVLLGLLVVLMRTLRSRA